MVGIGCHCAVNILALTAAPYEHGCYGKGLEDSIGWPVYRDPRGRLRAFLDFLRGR